MRGQIGGLEGRPTVAFRYPPIERLPTGCGIPADPLIGWTGKLRRAKVRLSRSAYSAGGDSCYQPGRQRLLFSAGRRRVVANRCRSPLRRSA